MASPYSGAVVSNFERSPYGLRIDKLCVGFMLFIFFRVDKHGEAHFKFQQDVDKYVEATCKYHQVKGLVAKLRADVVTLEMVSGECRREDRASLEFQRLRYSRAARHSGHAAQRNRANHERRQAQRSGKPRRSGGSSAQSETRQLQQLRKDVRKGRSNAPRCLL